MKGEFVSGPCPDCASTHFKAPLDFWCGCECHTLCTCVDCADLRGDQALDPLEVKNERLKRELNGTIALAVAANRELEVLRSNSAEWQRRANQVAIEAEREACAILLDLRREALAATVEHDAETLSVLKGLAAEIRARGEP